MSESQKTKDDAAKKAAEEAADAKASKKARRSDSDSDAPTPDWQKPDYNGPLDAEQAAWRNRHKAAWRNPSTKPVEGGDAK